jgi:hypothetical protein
MVKGPRPKGEYVGKSSVFSTRIRPDLRKRLEVAAKTSGRSLSQEVEHRLRRSFVEDDKIADAFGDRRTFRLMRMIADAIRLAEPNGAEAGDWLNNPFDFQIALGAALSVLEAVAPEGPALPDDADFDASTIGSIYAAKLWLDVKNAKASIQLNEGSHSDHINSVAQSDIGLELIKRVEPSIRAAAIRSYAKALRSETVQDILQDLQEEQFAEEKRGEK